MPGESQKPLEEGRHRSQEVICLPSYLHQREFGFQLTPEKESFRRYYSFSSGAELVKFLHAERPYHAYYSLAKYGEPSRRGVWLGTELAFDFDVDPDEGGQERSLRQVVAVVECLEKHFGLDPREMSFTDTGNRGHHCIVHDERLLGLTAEHRGQIVDYLFDRVRPRPFHLDVQVTRDLSRLIRLPGTVHGKTAKRARALQYSEILELARGH